MNAHWSHTNHVWHIPRHSNQFSYATPPTPTPVPSYLLALNSHNFNRKIQIKTLKKAAKSRFRFLWTFSSSSSSSFWILLTFLSFPSFLNHLFNSACRLTHPPVREEEKSKEILMPLGPSPLSHCHRHPKHDQRPGWTPDGPRTDAAPERHRIPPLSGLILVPVPFPNSDHNLTSTFLFSFCFVFFLTPLFLFHYFFSFYSFPSFNPAASVSHIRLDEDSQWSKPPTAQSSTNNVWPCVSVFFPFPVRQSSICSISYQSNSTMSTLSNMFYCTAVYLYDI